ncbi:amino acid ABC transporter permease [Pseudocitrobacter faecalis]|uniref:amino acid ABC transporter permease n=1 Tax=Pseudocitrobacter faecalis TaxID=1398493 RepID=UPI00389AE47F
MTHLFDWQGVLTGQPLQWILSGFLTTLWVTLAGIVLASLLAILFLALRLSGGLAGRGVTAAWVSLFRNTPLLVQLLFWYFAAWNLLPQGMRDFVNDDHAWSTLPGNVWWLTPEFLCSAWGLGVFTSAFLIEEVASGLHSVSNGQREAALAQGFSSWGMLQHILLPQGLANAWQPIVGQYLNLMKLSSLASGIGFAELTYQVRQIESYNAHALEAFAVGTVLYLITGVVLGFLFTRVGPPPVGTAKRVKKVSLNIAGRVEDGR